MSYREIFSDTDAFLDILKKANRITESEYVTLERAVFLSWWCDKGDCKFCFMSTQKDRIVEPLKARRKLSGILAEAAICKRIGWNIEFLSGGYGSYSTEEIKNIAEIVAYITEAPVWLNVGALSSSDIGKFGGEVEGIVGAVETVNKKLHRSICPSKPVQPIVRMLKEAREIGLKTGITIILGLGEGIEDLPALFELIKELALDRVTFYSLNPQEGTGYENQPPPSSIYQAGVIALTRINFPDIEIIGGTWTDQLPNIGLILLAGANGITKYPLFSMFGNRYGRKVEEEIKFANRKLLGTFSDLDVLRGTKKLEKERVPNHVFKKKKPSIAEEVVERISEMRKEIDTAIEEYISTICAQLTPEI